MSFEAIAEAFEFRERKLQISFVSYIVLCSTAEDQVRQAAMTRHLLHGTTELLSPIHFCALELTAAASPLELPATIYRNNQSDQKNGYFETFYPGHWHVLKRFGSFSLVPSGYFGQEWTVRKLAFF